MRQITSLFLLFMLAVSFVNFHSLGKFLIEEPLKRGEVGIAYFTVRNTYDEKVKDVNTHLYIYDLDLRYSSVSDDVSKKDHVVQRLFMPIPKKVQPGNYLAKVSVGNDYYKDTQHIYIRIV